MFQDDQEAQCHMHEALHSGYYKFYNGLSRILISAKILMTFFDTHEKISLLDLANSILEKFRVATSSESSLIIKKHVYVQ